MQLGLFMMPLPPPERACSEAYARDLAQIVLADQLGYADRIRQLYDEVGGFGKLLTITQDAGDPAWDHRSLQLLMEEVGPRLADLS